MRATAATSHILPVVANTLAMSGPFTVLNGDWDATLSNAHTFLVRALEFAAEGDLANYASCLRLAAEFATDADHEYNAR